MRDFNCWNHFLPLYFIPFPLKCGVFKFLSKKKEIFQSGRLIYNPRSVNADIVIQLRHVCLLFWFASNYIHLFLQTDIYHMYFWYCSLKMCILCIGIYLSTERDFPFCLGQQDEWQQRRWCQQQCTQIWKYVSFLPSAQNPKVGSPRDLFKLVKR